MFARYFIGVVSIVCLSATLFTFLTFLIDVSRFRYPERPIIFYAVCYMMVSLVFFLGFLLEDKVSCNAASPGRFRASTVTQGSHNKVTKSGLLVFCWFSTEDEDIDAQPVHLLSVPGLHPSLHGVVFLHHGRQCLVGHSDHHLVPGCCSQVGQ